MKFGLPFSESMIIYLGLATVVLGIILLIILIYQALNRRFSKKEKNNKKKPPGCAFQTIRVLLIFLLIFWGLGIILFGAFVQSLTVFRQKELIAEVRCQEVDPNTASMKLLLTETKGRDANVPQEFLLTGDQWFIRGDIFTWDDWAHLFGLRTMYKLTRIGGFFTNTIQEHELKPTSYSLVPEEETSTWRWLYKNGYKFPVVHDVYGNSVYQYPEINKIFKIYVTNSGFAIETEEK